MPINGNPPPINLGGMGERKDVREKERAKTESRDP